MAHPIQADVRNHILSRIPALEFSGLAHNLVRVEHTLGETLHRAE